MHAKIALKLLTIYFNKNQINFGNKKAIVLHQLKMKHTIARVLETFVRCYASHHLYLTIFTREDEDLNENE